MLADVSPNLLEVAPGESCTFAVHIVNPTSLIDAYEVSIFGLDPTWVTVGRQRLSLFPAESGDVEVTLMLPPVFPAGYRQLSVHVRSHNDPNEFTLTPLGLVALGQPRLSARVDPVIITGGSEATFGLVVHNEGNTTVDAVVSVTDPEETAETEVVPATLSMPPGHQEVVQVTVRGKRPWVGAPKVRMFTFAVDSTSHVEAIGTFIQKPRIGRWLLSLLGLLAAAAVFAVVLSRMFDNVVNEAGVDKGLLSEALDKGATGGQTTPVNPGVVTGKVVLFNTREGVAGVKVELFDSGNTKVAIASAATAEGGGYTFGRLSAGKYKIRYSGAGFEDLWFEAGPTAADATEVEVALGKTVKLDDVELGGRPGTVKGTVDAVDLTGITATLVVPGTATDATAAEVRTLEVSADGAFVFEQVPSPATYQLIVSKDGFATETRTVVLGAAQTVDGIDIVLRKGDGLITGHILDSAPLPGASPALGGVTVEATDGTTKISTVSLTDGDIGAFALRALTTPKTYTLTITRDGYRSETRTVVLSNAQAFDAGTISLAHSTGSIRGTVTQIGGGPIGGVSVSVTVGEKTITTFTASTGDVGTYFIDKLPIPATYTITYSATGLVSQVRVQDLDPTNNTGDATAVDIALGRSDASVAGVVRGVDTGPVAGATIVLSDGTTSRTLVSANDPVGQFAFSSVPPGAYTVTASLPGTSPSVRLVNVVPDHDELLDITLEAQASATGQVLLLDAQTNTYKPYAGATVRLYRPVDFPGAPSTALQTVTTDTNGNFLFTALDAPENYVIAVFQTASSADPLDSQLILTQPSAQLSVPTFMIPVLF
jgi:hypothetical protein